MGSVSAQILAGNPDKWDVSASSRTVPGAHHVHSVFEDPSLWRDFLYPNFDKEELV
jgi:hypothetical protein